MEFAGPDAADYANVRALNGAFLELAHRRRLNRASLNGLDEKLANPPAGPHRKSGQPTRSSSVPVVLVSRTRCPSVGAAAECRRQPGPVCHRIDCRRRTCETYGCGTRFCLATGATKPLCRARACRSEPALVRADRGTDLFAAAGNYQHPRRSAATAFGQRQRFVAETPGRRCDAG